MTDSVALIAVDPAAFAYDFGPSHPLRPERVSLTYDRIGALGLTERPNVRTEGAGSASDEQLTAVHAPDFVACVRAIDEGEAPASDGFDFGLGTPDDPIFAGMHASSAAVCGASVRAAELVVEGQADHAFNPAGGLHHARRAEASGFCIYNDPAVAIARILELRPDWRVMYVDVDVHHGDGVQWIFYENPKVLTVSLHQSGRYLYPGTGFEDEIGAGQAVGSSINVPLLPYTGEADYLWALERVLTDAARAFRPQVLVTQLGADTHHGDPLANLGLTMSAYPRMSSLLHQTARDLCGNRWVATGGGGYQFDTVVPKVWTMHFAGMCEAPESIPEEWLDDFSSEEVSRSYSEPVKRSVEQVLGECLPLLAKLSATSRDG